MPLSWLENERTHMPVGLTQADGNKNVRRMLVPYGYGPIGTLEEKLLGTAFLQGGLLQRQLPWKDPQKSALVVMRCEHRGLAYRGSEESDEPSVPMTTANVFEFWEITASLARPPYLLGEIAPTIGDPDVIVGVTPTGQSGEVDRYATKVVRSGRFFLNAKEGNFYWDNPTGQRVLLPYPIPERVSYEEIEVTLWHWPIECYPASAIKLCLGTLNNGDLKLPTVPVPAPPTANGKYPAKTLLLEEVRTQEMEFPDGRRGLNITYHYGHQPKGWDKVPGPDGVWRAVYRGQSTDGIFEQTNHDKLFQIEQQF